MANLITNITVNDSVALTPVSGANVFVNGVGVGATNSLGQLPVSVAAGTTFTLTITAPGYSSYGQAGVTAGAVLPPLLIVASSPAATLTFNLICNPDSAAVGTLFTFSNGGSPIATTYTSGGVNVPGLSTSVTQTITGSVSNYAAVNQTFPAGATSGTVELTSTSSAGPIQPMVTAVTQNPNTALTVQTNSQGMTTSPEFVAPNSLQLTYFTMTQARMYIGNLFIDELNSIQFALQANQLPVYGYASRDYDALAQGKALVQGQLTINFISEGYLYQVLNEYSVYAGQPSVPANPIAASSQTQMTNLVSALNNPSLINNPSQQATAKQQILNLASGPNGKSIVTTAAAQQTQLQKNLTQNTMGLPGGDYPNAVYQNTAFKIIINFEGAGRTITRILEDCTLISNESIMDHNGQPIMDSYGFIARRLR
jgi:hypothetical protein